MVALAKVAVVSFVLFASAWLLLDWGTVDDLLADASGAGEADNAAFRGVRRLAGSDAKVTRQKSSYSFFVSACWQAVYGLIYYFVIVTKYPEFQGDPTEEARETQSKNEVVAFLTCENSFVINLSSCLCSAGRAAHTYDKTGLMPYWEGLLLSAFCPCATLLYMNACTNLNEKLGGETRGFLMAVICSCFFPCCVIAQDAQALDQCTGVAVGLCGVEQVDGGDAE